MSNDNMSIYNDVRSVPEEAKKTISAGKLKGFSDINPMWRIKVLTETFGVCGFGWYTEIKNKWMEKGDDGRVAAFVEIHLFVKIDAEWSKPIIGIGGSMFVNIFKGNLETSDEAYKMAYTDAISVACKALGIGADVYYAKDNTKYNIQQSSDIQQEQPKIICPVCKKTMQPVEGKSGKVISAAGFLKQYGKCICCLQKEREKEDNLQN